MQPTEKIVRNFCHAWTLRDLAGTAISTVAGLAAPARYKAVGTVGPEPDQQSANLPRGRRWQRYRIFYLQLTARDTQERISTCKLDIAPS